MRDLDTLDATICRKIIAELPILAENPFPRGKLIKKIRGKKTVFYRLRIDTYRVFYSIETADVVILRVVGKKDAHKFIKRVP